MMKIMKVFPMACIAMEQGKSIGPSDLIISSRMACIQVQLGIEGADLLNDVQ